MRPQKVAAIAVMTVATLVIAVVLLPPLLLRDRQAPASLAPFIDGARHKIRTESNVLYWPLHLRFVEARCSTEHPGRVALIFEEWHPPYLTTTYAVAWRGSMPTSPDDSWGGGAGMRSVYDDDEFVYQMGLDTVPCP